jgi:hypothetical protein
MHFLIILALSIAVGALLYRFVRQRSPSRVLTLGGAFLASVLTFGALVPTATHSPTSPVQASDEQHDRAVETAQSPAAAQMSQASAKTLYINAGAMICGDMLSMNHALAISRANNPYAVYPDECVVMQAAAPTRIMVESTAIPGVVVIQAGDTAAMAQRSDLTYR